MARNHGGDTGGTMLMLYERALTNAATPPWDFHVEPQAVVVKWRVANQTFLVETHRLGGYRLVDGSEARENPMKCLLVSDLHYTLKQLDWLAQVAGDFDVVVIAGDHLDISSNVAEQVQILVTLKYLRGLKDRTQVLACSGNHDLDTRNDAGEKVAGWTTRIRQLGIPTDGDHLERDGTLFTICPWWDGPRAREIVGQQLERDAARPKQRWIWVYHAPPSDSPTCQSGARAFGDDALLEWIHRYQPDLVLCGHIHGAPFSKNGSWFDQKGATVILNSGRQIGPCPTHIIFDTRVQRAAWFSMEGSETAALDAPVRPTPTALTEAPDWLGPPAG